MLKPPIIVRRGAQGFGFTLRAIRVYIGDSDFYTVHHLVSVSFYQLLKLKFILKVKLNQLLMFFFLKPAVIK